MKNTANYIFFIKLLICLASVSCVVQKKMEDINMVIWEKNKFLTWRDFNGKPKALKIADAHIDCDIHYQTLDSTHFLIFAYMNARSSWHKSNSSRVLMHEQYHFNIAEAYARTIRRKVFEEKMDIRNKAFKSFYNTILEEYHDAQALYDEETKHSLNIKEQAKWQHRIDATLLQLDKYAEITITI